MANFEILITAKNAAKSAFTQLKADLKGVASNLKNLDAQYEAATKSATELLSIGTKMAAVGAGMFAGVAFPVGKAAQFERAMAKVKAITGATGEDFESLTKIAKEMGATTEYTAKEAAQGLTFLGMAGLSSSEAIKALPGALQLATVGEISLAQAADYATNVLSGMGLAIEDLGRVNDNMAYTASNANTSVTELADGMVTAGPAAKGAGIDLEEVVAVLGGMAQGGIKASRAGFAVKRILSLLQDPTGKASSKLKEMGIATHDLNGNFRGLLPIITEMGEKQISLNEANEAFGLITGVSVIAAANNARKMNELRLGLEKAEGSAEKMSKIMRDNLIGSFKDLRSAIEALLIALGEGLLKPVRELIKAFTFLIRNLEEFARTHKTLTKVILGTIAVLGTLFITLGSLGIALGTSIFAFINLHKAILFLQSLAVVTRIQLWILSINQFVAASKLATIALNAGLILAIGAVIYKTYQLIKVMREAKIAHEQLAKSTQMLADMEHKAALRAQKAALDTGLKIKNFKQLVELQKQGLIQYDKEADKYIKVTEARQKYNNEVSKRNNIQAQIGDLNAFQKAAMDAYTYAMDVAKQYANKVVEFNEKIKYHRLSTEDKIRQLQRKTLSEEDSWNDKKIQAEENVNKARQALRKEDYKLAEKLVQDAQSLYSDLAVEVSKTDTQGNKVIIKGLENTVKVAKQGLIITDNVYKSIQEKQKKAAENAAKTLLKDAEKIKSVYDSVKQYVSEKIPISFNASELQFVQEKIKQLKEMSESKFDINVDLNLSKVMEDLKVKVSPEIRLEQGSYTNLKKDMEKAFRIEDGIITNLKEQQKRMYYIDDGVITNVKKKGAEAFTIDEALIALNKERKKEALKIEDEIVLNNQRSLEEAISIKQETRDQTNDLINSMFKIDTERVNNVISHVKRLVNAFSRILSTPIPKPPQGFATGGRLPGFGGGDKLTIRAEPGEYVINKYSVKALGVRFFDFINSVKSSGFKNDMFSRLSFQIPSFDVPKLSFQTGGVVPNLQTKDLGTIDLKVNQTLYPVMGEVDVLEKLKTVIEREKLTRAM